MKPLRIFLWLLMISGIMVAFGYFVTTGNFVSHYEHKLHGYPRMVLKGNNSGKVFIKWNILGKSETGVFLYDSISHKGDPSKYAFEAKPLIKDEIKLSPFASERRFRDDFYVELSGLNPLTTYYFVLKSNSTISNEFFFVAPPK
jgi:hypothetical protein